QLLAKSEVHLPKRRDRGVSDRDVRVDGPNRGKRRGPLPRLATRAGTVRARLSTEGGGIRRRETVSRVELNEAFASQAVACMRDLGIPPERTNSDGGAIALGHPLGATGACIIGKAAQTLKREGKRFALATQCIGGGQGIATILEAA